MSIDLNSIDRAIETVKVKLDKEAVNASRKVAFAIDNTLVLATPVDTGRARANWLPSLNVAITSVTDAVDKSGSGAIAKLSSVMSNFKLGDDVYISNNLPYIGRLNDGYSKQAPIGFVEKAVQTAKSALEL
jgi:hypothetical protein